MYLELLDIIIYHLPKIQLFPLATCDSNPNASNIQILVSTTSFNLYLVNSSTGFLQIVSTTLFSLCFKDLFCKITVFISTIKKKII